MTDVLLQTHEICKDFSSVQVLTDVNVQVFRGEILGIIGENGAGKSTLMKILSGIYTASSGDIEFEGRPVRIDEPRVAKELGISIIPQEFNLIRELTVYDNVFLGSELKKRSGLLDKREMIERTSALLHELGVDIRPHLEIERLSTAQKQMVEICKAVACNAKLLIMDEPTTVLTSHEIEILFNLMRRLKKQGTTIIYISHKLKEVKAICDRVTILRDGVVVATERVADISVIEMAQRMVGRELSQVFPEKNRPEEEVVFEVRGLTVPGVIEDISFQLHAGEILGLAGLVGAGRTEVAETIMGIRKHSAGQFFLHGRPITLSSPREAVACGINYLSEDRQGTGVLTSFTVDQNTTLVSLPAYCRSLLKLIDRRATNAATEKHVERFNIKTRSLNTRLEFLSGGNQQKVSLAKSIDPDPIVLIADEPTRGVDVSAKQEIYRLIHALAGGGISCILISSEQEEIIGMCHRVIVMREGRATGLLDGGSVTEEEIMYLATGVREGA